MADITVQTLKNLIEVQKHQSFIDPSKATDAEALGILLSHYFEWDGQKIFETAQAAFEDSNFHTFNEKFAEAWAAEEAA